VRHAKELEKKLASEQGQASEHEHQPWDWWSAQKDDRAGRDEKS
jgi:hypothetical protein